MWQEGKLKVCFVLPETVKDTATHFAHKWELIKELEDRVDFLVCQPTMAGIVKMKFAYFFRGCRTFYIHYSFKGAFVALMLTKLFGGRVFYWNCGMPWLYKRSAFEEHLFKFILRHTIFVTGSENIAGDYMVRYGLDAAFVRVIPNFIRISEFQKETKREARNKLGLPQDKKIVLFLHHLSRRKGAHVLPEIMKEFSGQNDVLFLVAGDGPERNSLELREKVQIVGNISNARTPLYFAAADVYLMPSEEEGMPNALLEAMAASVPFVASDVAAVREMTPAVAHEFILPYGNTHLFAEKIKKLLADEELRKQISVEEQEWVKRFDVSVIAPKFLELFQEL